MKVIILNLIYTAGICNHPDTDEHASMTFTDNYYLGTLNDGDEVLVSKISLKGFRSNTKSIWVIAAQSEIGKEIHSIRLTQV